jgi:hypothetical protein
VVPGEFAYYGVEASGPYFMAKCPPRVRGVPDPTDFNNTYINNKVTRPYFLTDFINFYN